MSMGKKSHSKTYFEKVETRVAPISNASVTGRTLRLTLEDRQHIAEFMAAELNQGLYEGLADKREADIRTYP
jgi:hypothetical protein